MIALRRRPRLLPLVVAGALLPLLLFKYADFILQTLTVATGATLPHLGLGLPLGISFVTFSVISLLVDSRRSKTEPANLLTVGLYITFFPHLIAGPILRPHQIIPQLGEIRLDWAAMPANLTLFAVGMLKKVLIADPVGAVADQLYAQSVPLSGGEAWLAALAFHVQIYCDFSAYSDMAIALAAMLGIAFPHNFRSPYLAGSITELWQRWHMTLSFWLRDYVFKPLASYWRRLPRPALAAIVVTMAVSGLWHGAGATFIVWGTAHGLVMLLEHVSGAKRRADRASGLARIPAVIYTNLVFAFLTIFFRSPDLATAGSMVSAIAGANGWGGLPPQTWLIVGLAALTLALHPWDRVDTIRTLAARLPGRFLVPVTLAVIISCAMLAAGRPQNFYYFVF